MERGGKKSWRERAGGGNEECLGTDDWGRRINICSGK
jgi:hypothetical protein